MVAGVARAGDGRQHSEDVDAVGDGRGGGLYALLPSARPGASLK